MKRIPAAIASLVLSALLITLVVCFFVGRFGSLRFGGGPGFSPHWMMGGHMGVVMMLFWVIVILAFVFLVSGLFTTHHGSSDTPRGEPDALEILNALVDCDGHIIATPLYAWTYSGLMKTFLDRFISLVTGFTSDAHKSLIEGKRAALLVTCGGPVDKRRRRHFS